MSRNDRSSCFVTLYGRRISDPPRKANTAPPANKFGSNISPNDAGVKDHTHVYFTDPACHKPRAKSLSLVSKRRDSSVIVLTRK